MGSGPPGGQQGVDLWALSDLCTPWCIHVAATLRIADNKEKGVSEIAGLTKAASCDRDALHSVLGHLVSKGVFEEPSPGRFALNEQEVFGRPFWEDIEAQPEIAAAFDALIGPAGHGIPNPNTNVQC